MTNKPVKKIALTEIKSIYKSRFELRHLGLEFSTKDKYYFFAFNTSFERDDVYSLLLSYLKNANIDLNI